MAKSAAKIVGKVLSLSATGIGTVAAAFTFIIDAFRFLKSREGKEFLKKINPFNSENAVKLAIGLGRFIYANIGAIFGAGGGLLFGPAGVVAGGFLGHFIGDKFLIPLFRGGKTFLANLSIGGGAAEAATIGKGIPGLASLTPEAAIAAQPAAAGFFANLGPAIAVPITITATVGLTTAAIISQQAAFVGPFGPTEGVTPHESEYIKVEKTADKTYFENSEVATSQTITYTVEITPKKGALCQVQIEDKITLDSNQSPPIPELILVDPQNIPSEISTPTLFTYQINNIDSQYQDTRIRNTFTLTAQVDNDTDSVTASKSINIGQPPLPADAQLAEAIVNALLGCNGLSPSNTNGVIVNRASWPTAKQCLIGAGIDYPVVINTLEKNINKWNLIQCVGFDMAASMLHLPGKSTAAKYCHESTPGYELITSWGEIAEGDHIVSDRGAAGHIAVVVLADGDIVRVAEAMGDTGSVQFRPLGLAVLESRYCGFLRKN